MKTKSPSCFLSLRTLSLYTPVKETFEKKPPYFNVELLVGSALGLSTCGQLSYQPIEKSMASLSNQASKVRLSAFAAFSWAPSDIMWSLAVAVQKPCIAPANTTVSVSTPASTKRWAYV